MFERCFLFFAWLVVVLSLSCSQLLLAQSGSSYKSGSQVAKSNVVQPALSWKARINVPHRSWVPREKPCEILLCVHGLGFSSESFREFGRSMAGCGMAVYAVDVRGFGQWMNRRNNNSVDFEACLVDVEDALKTLRKAYPGVPVYLVGESMGGAIAMRAVSRNPQLVDGLISAVPSSDRYGKLTTDISVSMRYIANKDKPMNIGQEVIERSTADSKLQKSMEKEKTNRMTLTPRELKQFDDFMKGNYDAAALIEKTPVLMLVGFKDKLVKPEGTIELFNALSVSDKLLMVVGDGEHLLLEERHMTGQLATMLVDWIRSESALYRNKK